jgi:phospholipid/cholesterol/gamma-HCH transport system substrate-binding protein
MKKLFSSEVIIGFLVILAMAILFIGIDFLKGINVFKKANYYYVEYTNVEGLAVSAPVTVNGYKVGQVAEIEYEYDNPGHIKVELSLDQSMRVPMDTKAVLSSDILGTAGIALQLGTSTTDHKSGDLLDGEVASGLMDAVSTQIMPGVAAIFPKIDSLLTNVNALVSNQAVLASVQRLDAITANLEATTRQLNAMVGSLPPIVNNVKGITGNVNTASGDMAVLTGKLKEMPVDSLAANLQAITANLQVLTEQLNDPNSTIGLLTRDPQLYNNLNATVSSLDSLFIDIKKNPKRYINIKLL